MSQSDPDRAEPITAGDSADRYRQRREEAAARSDHLGRRARAVSNLRLLAFATGIAGLVWAELEPDAGPWALALFGIALLTFLALLVVHARVTTRERRAAELARVNAEGVARLQRDWDDLPAVEDAGPPGHPYAHDLDLFGHGSLARFLATTGTGLGRRRLDRWLLEPSDPEQATDRQAAVRDLVRRLDLRQELQVTGRLAGDPDPAALDAFLEWAESEPWLLRRPWLIWLSRMLPLATLILLALQVDGSLARPWWIPTLAAGVVLAVVYGKRIHRLMARASLGDASLRHYAGLVARIQEERFDAPRLAETRSALTDPCDARQELERLGWITELAELRHGGIFYLLLHLPTLWDFHVLWGLERWQLRVGHHAREWTDGIADIDALAALASPALDEPGWSFPELAPRGDRMEATGLAHPLLPPDVRVPNDVSLGPPGTFVMVTGSNMSGKSTLLRAIGVNAVLARAGGPVCATSLRIPPLELRTSMRVEDSLERGVSLFMAELQQLKRVVDTADRLGEESDDASGAHNGGSGALLLYLLDEVLHGTNSAERQVAVREVLSHLLRRPAIGAISTHDLALADAAPLSDAVVPVHFRETVHPEGHDPPMSFDYRLRDGVATSTNALKLVRLVGLA